MVSLQILLWGDCKRVVCVRRCALTQTQQRGALSGHTTDTAVGWVERVVCVRQAGVCYETTHVLHNTDDLKYLMAAVVSG